VRGKEHLCSNGLFIALPYLWQGRDDVVFAAPYLAVIFFSRWHFLLSRNQGEKRSYFWRRYFDRYVRDIDSPSSNRCEDDLIQEVPSWCLTPSQLTLMAAYSLISRKTHFNYYCIVFLFGCPLRTSAVTFVWRPKEAMTARIVASP